MIVSVLCPVRAFLARQEVARDPILIPIISESLGLTDGDGDPTGRYINTNLITSTITSILTHTQHISGDESGLALSTHHTVRQSQLPLSSFDFAHWSLQTMPPGYYVHYLFPKGKAP